MRLLKRLVRKLLDIVMKLLTHGQGMDGTGGWGRNLCWAYWVGDEDLDDSRAVYKPKARGVTRCRSQDQIDFYPPEDVINAVPAFTAIAGSLDDLPYGRSRQDSWNPGDILNACPSLKSRHYRLNLIQYQTCPSSKLSL